MLSEEEGEVFIDHDAVGHRDRPGQFVAIVLTGGVSCTSSLSQRVQSGQYKRKGLPLDVSNGLRSWVTSP